MDSLLTDEELIVIGSRFGLKLDGWILAKAVRDAQDAKTKRAILELLQEKGYIRPGRLYLLKKLLGSLVKDD